MREIGVFTPEQARLLWQDYEARKQLAPQLQQNFPQRRVIDEPSPHRVRVFNSSGQEAPPYACMQVVGTTDGGGISLVTVQQPQEMCGEFIFNSQHPIPPGGIGWAYAYGVVRMLGSGNVEDGCKRAGPVANSWGIGGNGGPFVIYGADPNIPGAAIGRHVGEICRARWIRFEYSGGSGSVDIIQHYDGVDPSECGEVEIDYPLGEPCPGDEVMAFWDTNSGKYIAVDTKASMLGEPEEKTIILDVRDSNCGIELKEFEVKIFKKACDTEYTLRDVDLGTPTSVLLAISSSSCGRIDYVSQSIRAWLCDEEPVIDYVDLSFGSKKFVSGIEFGPPACAGSATYAFNTGTNQWDLTIPCANGCESVTPEIPDPLPTSTITTTAPCGAPLNSQCGINVTLEGICDDSYYTPPQVIHLPMPLVPLEVMLDVVDNETDALVKSYATIYICNYSLDPDREIEIGECETPTSSGGP